MLLPQRLESLCAPTTPSLASKSTQRPARAHERTQAQSTDSADALCSKLQPNTYILAQLASHNTIFITPRPLNKLTDLSTQNGPGPPIVKTECRDLSKPET